MNHDFWLKRWQTGDTGWHQDDFEPRLLANFPKLAPTTVFVPLCGKSRDLLWLAQQGHQIIGVELSTLAIEQFFAESGISNVLKVAHGKLEKYQGGNFTIYHGDFFDLTWADLEKVSAVYDRAALIALPAELQIKYAAHLCKLLQKDTRMLLVTLDYEQARVPGPPFAVPDAAVKQYYEASFSIRHLVREKTTALSPKFDGTSVSENVYFLTKMS